jgi:lipoprotein-anchoring transpeptidase ErfK/SrfK
MRMTTLIRKLPALLLALAAGQVALASAAGAAPGLLGLLIPPPPPPPVVQPAQAAPPPATPPLLPIEKKLAELHYDVGPVDGNVDEQTISAILAFQKVYGLERTGGLTDPVTTQILATKDNPPALVPGDTSPNKVEIDLRRQVLFLYENGSLSKILPVSSGTAKTPTPTGDYKVYRYDSGWHTSPLGQLYNAEYFVGGYAIHGAKSVPAEPASHGCVRIPMTAAEWFPQHVTNGTPVHVLAG